jgi:hypothetical protein
MTRKRAPRHRSATPRPSTPEAPELTALEQRLAAFARRPTSPRLTWFALTALVNQQLHGDKTRAAGGRWLEALEDASRLEHGTCVTVGLDAHGRKQAAVDAILRVASLAGKEIPHARAVTPDAIPWADVVRDYYLVRGDLGQFRRRNPAAPRRDLADAVQQIYRERLGAAPPLSSHRMNALLRALSQSKDGAARLMIARAHGVEPEALKKHLARRSKTAR